MCGIFGVMVRGGPVPQEILEGAQRSLAHRGPDDTGMVVIESRERGRLTVGFAHTRLAILDLSPLGHQPMQDPATGNWIAYNGEITNFRELRAELARSGAAFRSQSDTEVILAAYRVWGEDFVTRLRGMFAFALWDAQQECLLLARDPMGIKPLYYCAADRTFLFGSEIRTLLGTGVIPRRVSATGVLSYLAFGSVCEPWTIIDGVRSLPPASLLILRDGAPSIREYWSPIPSAKSGGGGSRRNGSSPALADTIRQAVLSHLVSDVPVGVFLSGGIDSSSLVAVMSANDVRASTFSLVFREPEFDEGQFSRAVARRFGTEHTEIPVSAGDTLAVLPDALRAMDQPSMDGFNTYFVSARARAAGVKVALTGLGADEMFAGYANFRRVPRLERIAARLRMVPAAARKPLAAGLSRFAGANDRSRKLAALAGEDSAFAHPYFLMRALFGAEELAALFPASQWDAAHAPLQIAMQAALDAAVDLDPVNQVSYLESYWYMKNTLLRDSDTMSMASSLELRVPFLDRDLVEACFNIPGTEKLRGSLPKSLLLSSLGVDLPPEIVHRPKRGFTLPFEQWLRGEMAPVVEEALTRTKSMASGLQPAAVHEVWKRFLAGKTSWSRPWALFVLQRWCEQNL